MPSVSQTSRNTPPPHKSRGASFYAGINLQNLNNKRYPGPHSDSNSPNSRKNEKNRTPFGVRELCQTNSIGILVHRPQAPGADIRPLDLTALAGKLDLLNVGAPSPSVFTVRVADLVAAQTTFSADTANFRHRR